MWNLPSSILHIGRVHSEDMLGKKKDTWKVLGGFSSKRMSSWYLHLLQETSETLTCFTLFVTRIMFPSSILLCGEHFHLHSGSYIQPNAIFLNLCPIKCWIRSCFQFQPVFHIHLYFQWTLCLSENRLRKKEMHDQWRCQSSVMIPTGLLLYINAESWTLYWGVTKETKLSNKNHNPEPKFSIQKWFFSHFMRTVFVTPWNKSLVVLCDHTYPK